MPSRAIRTAEANRNIRNYVLLGILTLIILVITMVTAGRQQTLRCERQESGMVDCVVRTSILGVIPLDEKTIAGAQAVSLGQQCVEVDCKYRLEIYAIQGLVPVDEKYSDNYDQMKAVRSQLNEFFRETERSFVGVKEQTHPTLIIGVVVMAVIIWAYLGYLTWRPRSPSQDG